MSWLLLFLLFTTLSRPYVYPAVPQDAGNLQWQPKDMNPAIENTIDVKFVNCVEQPCSFDLHYFIRKADAPALNPLNILYIPGGPGQIVDGERRDLMFLEGRHNVFYFDIRGAGLSSIPKSNRHDRFLRAEHIAADIEAIRRKEFTEVKDGKEFVKPWDAIYAHSSGTVVAQMYAKNYGKSAVTKLILSAPVARSLDDVEAISNNKGTEAARLTTIIENLENIYLNYREDPCAKTVNAGLIAHGRGAVRNMLQMISKAAVNFTGNSEKENDKIFIEGTNDFCFVDSDQMKDIRTTLREKLTNLTNEYGSISFVIRHYQELVEGHPTFKKDYPYPEEFYIALQTLQFLGAPPPPGKKLFAETRELFALEFDPELKKHQVNAALFLGYQLLPKPDEDCTAKQSADFFKNLIRAGSVFGSDSYYTLYCQRYNKAKEKLKPTKSSSDRASLVLGIHDGISRWVFAKLKDRLDSEGCLKGKGKDIEDLAAAPGTAKVMRNVLKKMGIQRDVKICLWNPKKYGHDVTTLILKGEADPIIAGCQAEEVFKNGLTGERAIIKFPGVGHVMALPVVKESKSVIGDENKFKILNKFLEAKTITDFKTNLEKQEDNKASVGAALRATIKTALKGQVDSIDGC